MSEKERLLYLSLFVFDVPAQSWIILFNNHLFGHCPRIFLCYVEMPGPRRGVQADFDRGRLRHDTGLRVRGTDASG